MIFQSRICNSPLQVEKKFHTKTTQQQSNCVHTVDKIYSDIFLEYILTFKSYS